MDDKNQAVTGAVAGVNTPFSADGFSVKLPQPAAWRPKFPPGIVS